MSLMCFIISTVDAGLQPGSNLPRHGDCLLRETSQVDIESSRELFGLRYMQASWLQVTRPNTSAPLPPAAG
eukprot:2570147-Amphidinium_carterae.1